MPFSVRYNAKKEILYGEVADPFTLEEYKELLTFVTGANDHPPDTKVLWDMRNFSFSGIDVEFNRNAVRILREFPQLGKPLVAYVVKDLHDFGMIRMFMGISAGFPPQMKPFTDYSDAEGWLIQNTFDSISI
jgi:hypothetical protein